MKKLTVLGYIVLGIFAIMGVISMVRVITSLFGILLVVAAVGAISFFAIKRRRA